MKAVIQRVKEAKVSIEGSLVSEIKKGMLVFICVQKDDTTIDADYLAGKLIDLRIFEDNLKNMNLSIKDIDGEFLVVSQFTLAADCNKGRRPSFDKAAAAFQAEKLYDYFIKKLQQDLSKLKVKAGKFKAMMQVSLVNDGPVTFILDSKNA